MLLLRAARSVAVWMAAAFVIGCSGGTPSTSPTVVADPAFIAKEEPAGAIGVGAARKSAKNATEVVITGRVGGSAEPFVAGLSAFTIVDPSLQPCGAEEGCPTPWDYCCDPGAVAANIATVKLVDGKGQLVAKSAKELLGIPELATVVVRGQAEVDGQGNLAIVASQVFIKK